jgi:Rod binding domain-containing protein
MEPAGAGTQQAAEREKLRNATRQMESYFVGTLLKKMHETASKGGMFESGSESSTYREMLDDAIAAEIGKRGAFGIADALYKQLVVGLDAQYSSGPETPGAGQAITADATSKKWDGAKDGSKNNEAG